MFARVSTYTWEPESNTENSEEVTRRVLQVSGCKGVYYLIGRENGKAMSITLWEDEESLVTSREAANKIRSDASESQHTSIIAIEEFEIAASKLQD